MKRLLFISLLLIKVTYSNTNETLQCVSDNYKVIISSYCKLPLMSLMDLAHSDYYNQADKNSRSTIKVYKDEVLVESSSYNCNGPYSEGFGDPFINTVFYKKNGLNVDISSFDDWGAKLGIQVTIDPEDSSIDMDYLVIDGKNCQLL